MDSGNGRPRDGGPPPRQGRPAREPEENGKSSSRVNGSSGSDGRDRTTGRFTRGNTFGRVSSNSYYHQLRRAARQELRPDDYRRIIRVMLEAAERGNVRAAQFLQDGVIGKARRAPPDPVHLDGLPDVATHDGAIECIAALFQLVVSGQLDHEQGEALVQLVRQARLGGGPRTDEMPDDAEGADPSWRDPGFL